LICLWSAQTHWVNVVSIQLSWVATVIFNVHLLHAFAFTKLLIWSAQTSVFTLKTQQHAVNACWKRQWQLSFIILFWLGLPFTVSIPSLSHTRTRTQNLHYMLRGTQIICPFIIQTLTLEQWFPTRVPWRGARGAAKYWIMSLSSVFYCLGYLRLVLLHVGVPPNFLSPKEQRTFLYIHHLHTYPQT